MAESDNNIPTECPGVKSDNAGKASACAGCPNQSICSSSDKTLDVGKIQVQERLKTVEKILFILSGKGGVGKSTFTTLLARTLSKKYPEKNFGVLDLDICGPSMPRMLGVRDEVVHQSGSGWSPVYVEDNLCVMSIGFLLSSPDDAIIWRGPKKNGIIKQFLSEVDWGQLDCLLLDMPPGTSDEHLSSISYILDLPLIKGAILVTTPQEISLLDVRKEIDFCQKSKLQIFGAIENMSCFNCKHCGKISKIFQPNTGGAKSLCDEFKIDFLGAVPLIPDIARNCDEGNDFANLDVNVSNILGDICERIMQKMI